MIADYQFYVPQLHCAACVKRLKQALSNLMSDEYIECDTIRHRVYIRLNTQINQTSDIQTQIQYTLNQHGFSAYPLAQQNQLTQQQSRQFLKRLFVSGLGMMQVGIFSITIYLQQDMPSQWVETFHWFSLLLTTPVLLYVGKPFFISAYQAWRDRQQVNMDTPISLALWIAYGYSCWGLHTGLEILYLDSINMLLFLLTLGRFVEWRTRYHAGQATEALWQALPKTAKRRTQHHIETIPIEALQPQDEIVIASGDTIPVDGHIIEGHSLINESLLTGESLPKEKSYHDRVFAGTLNTSHPIVIEVTETAATSTLAHIQHTLLQAEQAKPKAALLADRIAGVFMSVLIGIAMIVGLIWWWVNPTQVLPVVVSILIVTCPCALSLATPSALSAAMGQLARAGVLVTRSQALTQLPSINDILLDKTGTLTQGHCRLVSTDIFSKLDDDHCIQLASALEQGCEHPLAQAFPMSSLTTVQAEDLKHHPAMGISGEIDGMRYWLGAPERLADQFPDLNWPGFTHGSPYSRLALVSSTDLLALFTIADPIRAEAKSVLNQLEEKYRLSLISGDADAVVTHIATDILPLPHQWQRIHSRCTPEDKVKAIEHLQQQGQRVMMIGDGLNDGPVLAQADVGVAMGGGTDLAKASADIVLIQNTLTPLLLLFSVAKRTQQIIRQNLSWALIYNGCALPFAALGWIPPWLAAIGMSASSLLVVLNSSRLLQSKPSNTHTN